MAINRFQQYAPMQREDYAFHMPLDMIAKAAEHLQQKSDQNYAATQELPSLLNVQVHEADFQNRMKVENEYKQKIDELAAKYKGDYSNASKDIYALKSKLRQDLGHTGRLGSMGANYQSAAAYQKSLLEDKLLTQAQKAQAIKYSNARFSGQGGTGMVDPTTGQYNVFNGHRVTGYDYRDKMNKIPEIKALSNAVLTSTKEGNWFIDKTTKQKIVSEDRVRKIMEDEIFGDVPYKEFKQGMMQMGMDNPDIDVRKAIEGQVGIRAFNEYEEKIDREWDQQANLNQAWRIHQDKMAQDKKQHEDKMAQDKRLFGPEKQSIGVDVMGSGAYDDLGWTKTAYDGVDKMLMNIGMGQAAQGGDYKTVATIQNELSRNGKMATDPKNQILTYANPYIQGYSTNPEDYKDKDKKYLDVESYKLYQKKADESQRAKTAMEIIGRKMVKADKARGYQMNDFDQMSVPDRNKYLAGKQADPASAMQFRKMMAEEDKKLQQLRNNRENTIMTYGDSEEMLKVLNARSKSALAARTIVQAMDKDGNVIGTLNDVINEMKGDKDKLELNIVGANLKNGGRDFATIYTKDKTGRVVDSKEITLKNTHLNHEMTWDNEVRKLNRGNQISTAPILSSDGTTPIDGAGRLFATTPQDQKDYGVKSRFVVNDINSIRSGTTNGQLYYNNNTISLIGSKQTQDGKLIATMINGDTGQPELIMIEGENNTYNNLSQIHSLLNGSSEKSKNKNKYRNN